MKNATRHIAFAWIVLICFVTGQLMAIAHQHPPGYDQRIFQTAKQLPSPQSVSEKCYVCDMMHHTSMVLVDEVVTVEHYVISDTQYTWNHDYVGIALILSAGRSPPRA